MGKQYEHTHIAQTAKTGAGRRAIDARLPKIIESPKSLLALKGHSTSAICNAVLDELHILKRPFCKKLQRKNEILPFDAGGETHIGNLARLNDCSLFALVNSNKKRPHNLVLGRMFNFNILDMFEFGITNYVPSAKFPNLKSAPGSKPLVVFNGDDFDATPTTRTLRSLLLDIFRGPEEANFISLSGIDRVIAFSLKGESTVMFRQYGIVLKKSPDSTLPRVQLREAGPHFDMGLRRSQIAAESLMKAAMRKPKDPALVRKVKNVSKDEMGDKKGRIHMGKQDLSGLALARMKGLKKKRGFEAPDAEGTVQEGQGAEGDGDGGVKVSDGGEEETEPSPKRIKT
eukprot:GFKZ01004823.1.p1 GENE.GFKZ01004823.1~~GFKZ01004823.1.p1  ORF type:complete len:343 (-),score=48.39 GFKZ01004823.1:909-1937(-)